MLALPNVSTSMTEGPLSGVVRTVAAVLGRVRPLPLDGPGSEALVVRVIAGEVAVFDQATNGVATAIVNVLVLAHPEGCCSGFSIHLEERSSQRC